MRMRSRTRFKSLIFRWRKARWRLERYTPSVGLRFFDIYVSPMLSDGNAVIADIKHKAGNLTFLLENSSHPSISDSA